MKSTLGFTIYLEKFEYQYLLDLVEKYDIRKIRWSVAAPNISSLKTSIEAFYSSISDRLFDLYDYCLKNKIHIHGDCNYIQPCFWKTDKISNLLIRASGNLRFSCGNGSPVDIDVTGNAWRCYGLFKILKAKTSDFKNEVELEGYFNRRIGLLDNMAAFKECLECDYWKNGCFGGCYVFRIKRALKKVPNLVLFPIDDNTEILKCKPHINMNFKLVDNLESVKIISANKVIVNENENVIDFLKEIDGKKSLYELIKKWENNFSNFDIAKNTIIEQCRELFEKDMIRLNYDYPVKIENRNECFNNKNE
jgi:radical SAM protein with 4Fe4S-binding SPASM domain